MNQQLDNRKNEVALRRFAAVSFIEQQVREGVGIVEALRLAALRPWPDEKGQYWAARTLEDHWYAWKKGGFAALQPKSRADAGQFRKLPAEIGQWLLSQVSQYPNIPLKVLYERWRQAGKPLPSLRTLYRFLRAQGYDAGVMPKGILSDEFGFRPETCRWIVGGIDFPMEPVDFLPQRHPANVKVSLAAKEADLGAMLEAGEIDALISADVPRCVLEGSPKVGRLFEDYEAVERDY